MNQELKQIESVDEHCIGTFPICSIFYTERHGSKVTDCRMETWRTESWKTKEKSLVDKAFPSNANVTGSCPVELESEPEAVVSRRGTLERACAFHQPAGSVGIRGGTHVPRPYRARLYLASLNRPLSVYPIEPPVIHCHDKRSRISSNVRVSPCGSAHPNSGCRLRPMLESTNRNSCARFSN